MNPLRRLVLVAASCVLLPISLGAAYAATATAPTTALAGAEARLIVRFKASAASLRAKTLSVHASASDAASITQSRALALGQRMGVSLLGGHALDERTQVVSASGQDAQALVQRLSQDADVEWVTIDKLRKRTALPNDPLYQSVPDTGTSGGPASGQWYLKAPDAAGYTPVRPGGNIVSSINAVGAWAQTTGSAGVVVAVLDTGLRYDHPDLTSKLLPGYDMIHVAAIANDNQANAVNDRDPDASDPGDWVSQADINSGVLGPNCTSADIEDSSWHGTQVAGLIGAASNNMLGMAGVSWGSKILPVRVLGKCGGYDSDIIAAMQWAAGIAVPGVPANPAANWARVLNLSLGGTGSCDTSATTNPGGIDGAATAKLYTDAIKAVTSQGAVVVVAAGNGDPALGGMAVGLPANCPGVIAVLALRHVGTKVGFSDLGPEIAIAAPGGNCVNTTGACLYPMLSTTNTGLTVPALSSYTDAYKPAVGTSFSAPLVAGTVALMLSQRPSLLPSEIISVLKSTARAFPVPNLTTGVPVCTAPTTAGQLECYCTTSTCGAGMLDASAAVAAVAAPQARISYTPAAPQVGQAVQLSGADSQVAAGRSIKTYSWTLVDGGGIVTAFSSATNASTATLTASTAAGSFTVRLAVTDDLGANSSIDTNIAVVAAPTPTPSTGGGGGGGAVSWAWLLGLVVATLGLALNRWRVRPAQR